MHQYGAAGNFVSAGCAQTGQMSAKKNARRLFPTGVLFASDPEATCAVRFLQEPRSAAVVHIKLNRVSRHVQACAVLLLQCDVTIDQVVAEYAALLEEVAILVQCFQRLIQ